MKRTVRITVNGRLIFYRKPYKRIYRFPLENPILIKKGGKYYIKMGKRIVRVSFDDLKIIDEAFKGLWEVEGVKILRNRGRILIRVYLRRQIEIEDKPKTIVKLNKRGKNLDVVVLSGKEVIDEKRFKINKKTADELVKYAKFFKKPIIVCKDEIPGLRIKANLNGIDVVESFNLKINLKPILVGLLIFLAISALAMVYYSSFSVTTIKVEKKLDVIVDIEDVTIYAPGIGKKDIGDVKVNVYGSNTNYRVILQLANLEKPKGIRIIAIQVYDGNELKGIITPITPSLIIDEYNEGSKTYELKLFYIAIRPGIVKIAIQASVELI